MTGDAPVPEAPPAGDAPPAPTAADPVGRPGETARQRRAQRLAAKRRRELPARAAKTAAVGLAVALVLAGGAWAVPKLLGSGSDDCLWHEHATFRVFVNGEELRFQHSSFEMQRRGTPGLLPMKSHLHQPNDSLVHLEGACASVATFFEYMGMDLDRDSLRLDTIVHNGSAYASGPDGKLQFFLFEPASAGATEGAWRERPDAPSLQLRQDQRLLVTFGNLTAENIATQQGTVPPVAP